LARPEPTVRPARGAEEVAAAFAVRFAVFCDEQGVSREDELDGRDEEAAHFVAVRDGEVVGTCRLLVDGEVAKIGRMAVARSERRSGVGGRLLEAGETAARERGARRVVLAAQVQAEPFYAEHGYRAAGQPFEEAGIEHIRMEKALA
jgi:predicted GNAT family N-acyltransferase